ncbi:MAG TPA: ABC transporter permease [Terriglobales bacterium]|nr:ABC transporter permease [Terriglobales bacterium]
MLDQRLRNLGLILRREYLERVRTKSFIIMTFLMPVMMFSFAFLPSLLIGRRASGHRRLMVVTDNPQLAQSFRRQLQQFQPKAGESGMQYDVETSTDTSEAARAQLSSEIAALSLDGFLWMTEEAVRVKKVTFNTRAASDFVELGIVQRAVRDGILEQRLAAHSISSAEVDDLLKRVDLDVIAVKGGAGVGMLLMAVMLVLLLYMSVLMNGIIVMRSVLEEKNSRVMEVMLSTVTAKELMAGKILGVGAVGLTQMLIWGLMTALFGGSALLAVGKMAEGMHFTPAMIIFFPIFYLLGYLLYSALSAALGAAVNSQEEAQQWQFFIVLPLMASMVLMMPVFSSPSSTLSVVLSLIPFCAPVLMYMRIVAQQPPAWQIALSIALLVATIYGAMVLCARIYRVGILMYGKRPTLPEIVKWMKYA